MFVINLGGSGKLFFVFMFAVKWSLASSRGLVTTSAPDSRCRPGSNPGGCNSGTCGSRARNGWVGRGFDSRPGHGP